MIVPFHNIFITVRVSDHPFTVVLQGIDMNVHLLPHCVSLDALPRAYNHAMNHINTRLVIINV